MRLSIELFDEVVDALRAELRTSKDSRREPRVGLAGEASLLAIDNEGKHHSERVRVRDVSRSGLGIYHRRKFEKDHRFIVELLSVNHDPIWLVCITAYCRPANTDGHLIGARIQQVLRADQVRKIESNISASANSPTQLTPLQRVLVARVSQSILT